MSSIEQARARAPAPRRRTEPPAGRDHTDAVVLVSLQPRYPGSRWPVGLEPILGRSPIQRHLVHLARLGVRHCTLLLGEGPDPQEVEHECRRQAAEVALDAMSVDCRRAGDAASAPLIADPPGHIVITPAEAVYDPRLYRTVWESPAAVWLVDRPPEGDRHSGGQLRPIGLAKLAAPAAPADSLIQRATADFERTMAPEGREPDEQLAVRAMPTYLPDLRRHLPVYWCAIRTESDRERASHLILDAAQKGVLDFPARFLHPVPENLLTRACAGTPISPNQITVFTGALAFTGTYLFATQWFGWGLAIALLVNVLDGVDGKLARVRLQTSRAGDRLDHFLDVTFEFSWYLGLGWGLLQATGRPLPLQLGVGLIGVMIASRALSGVYRLRTGRQIHDDRAFDRAFRLVAGRRNIFVLMLVVGLAAGRLPEAFSLAFGWGAATALVYLTRIAMEFGRSPDGGAGGAAQPLVGSKVPEESDR